MLCAAKFELDTHLRLSNMQINTQKKTRPVCWTQFSSPERTLIPWSLANLWVDEKWRNSLCEVPFGAKHHVAVQYVYGRVHEMSPAPLPLPPTPSPSPNPLPLLDPLPCQTPSSAGPPPTEKTRRTRKNRRHCRPARDFARQLPWALLLVQQAHHKTKTPGFVNEFTPTAILEIRFNTLSKWSQFKHPKQERNKLYGHQPKPWPGPLRNTATGHGCEREYEFCLALYHWLIVLLHDKQEHARESYSFKPPACVAKETTRAPEKWPCVARSCWRALLLLFGVMFGDFHRTHVFSDWRGCYASPGAILHLRWLLPTSKSGQCAPQDSIEQKKTNESTTGPSEGFNPDNNWKIAPWSSRWFEKWPKHSDRNTSDWNTATETQRPKHSKQNTNKWMYKLSIVKKNCHFHHLECTQIYLIYLYIETCHQIAHKACQIFAK